MKSSRRRIEELTWALGLHSAAVRLHRVMSKRVDSSKLAEFYANLLPRRSLAFDIGANTGIYSDALERAGFRAIAVEPNPDCLRHIELSYRKRRIQTLHAIIGDRNGIAAINISDERDDASSVLEANDIKWSKKLAVPMVTLDSMIEYFGMPEYIKIDVEGFEAVVLQGLSQLPAMLSFEFHHLYAESARKVLDSPLFQRDCRFNVTDETGHDFKFESWIGLEEIREVGERIIKSGSYQDIYVQSTW